jgi:hypothetical protein
MYIGNNLIQIEYLPLNSLLQSKILQFQHKTITALHQNVH